MDLDTVFRGFKSSAYKRHLTTNHGVNSDGTECDPPVFGTFNGTQFSYCSKRNDAIVIPRLTEEAKDNRLISYFRDWVKWKGDRESANLKEKGRLSLKLIYLLSFMKMISLIIKL